MPLAVMGAKREQRLRHAVGAPVQRGGEGVEAQAVAPVPGQLDVRAGEGGAAEGPDDGHLVGRVVDRGEAVDEVPQLLRAEHEAPALHPERDPLRAQGALDRAQARARGEQHRDVAQSRRPDRAVALLHLPPLVQHRAAGGRDALGLRPADVPRPQVDGAAHPPDARAGERRVPFRHDGDVGRSDRAVGLAVDDLANDVVHPVDDRGSRAPVLGEGRELAADVLHPPPLGGVDGHVRAPEAVDRLLRVPHHEQPARLQPAGAVAGERLGDVDLPRVGVLELVDQQGVVAAPHHRPRRRVVAQQVPRPQDQVGEDQGALAPPPLRVLHHRPRHPGQDGGRRLGACRREQREHSVARRLRAVAGVLDRVAAGPVALLPDARAASAGLRPGGHPARPEPLVRPIQAVEEEQQLLEVGQQLVVADDPVQRQAAEPAVVVREDVPVGRGSLWRVLQDAGGDVCAFGEGFPEPLQVLDPEPQPQGAVDGDAVPVRRVDLLQCRAPALLEPPLGGELVEHRDLRVDPRLGAQRPQQGLPERVDRRELRPVQVVARDAAALPHLLGGGRIGDAAVQAGPDPLAQLGGGALRERDRRDALDPGPGGDERHHAVDQRARLAGARARLDEHRRVEVLRDRPAGGVVGAHGAAAAARTPDHGSTPGSASLRSKSSPRLRAQMRVKSQRPQFSNSA